MKRRLFLLIAISAFAKIFGLFREIVLSYFYGASSISDAYIISLTIPSVLFLIIGEGINKTYIPTFKMAEIRETEDEAINYSNQINISLLLFSALVVFITVVFTQQIIRMFAYGFDEDTMNSAILLTRISVFSVFFIITSDILIGFLQVKRKFSIVNIIGIPLNVVNIIFIIISAKFGLVYLAIGQVLATILQVLFLIIVALRAGYSFRFGFASYRYLQHSLRNAIPVITGKSVHQINKLVDKTIASGIIVGGISTLSYANRINILIQTIFVNPISMVMYTEVSEITQKGQVNLAIESIRSYFLQILIIVIPIVFGGLVVGDSLISVIYYRGAFDIMSLQMTAKIFKLYLIGAIGVALREIQANIFFANHNTKTPMINAVVSLILNIILNLILSFFWGLQGIALATSISAFVAAFLMNRSLRKEKIFIFCKALNEKIIRILLSGVAMYVFVYFVDKYFLYSLGDVLRLFISIGLGIVVYSISLINQNIEELNEVVKMATIKSKQRD